MVAVIADVAAVAAGVVLTMAGIAAIVEVADAVRTSTTRTKERCGPTRETNAKAVS
jgi:hypothetical protein